jgi:hypothetical protein
MPLRVAHATWEGRQAKSREPETCRQRGARRAGCLGGVGSLRPAPALVCAEDELARKDRCREPPAFLPRLPLRVPWAHAVWRAPERQLPPDALSCDFPDPTSASAPPAMPTSPPAATCDVVPIAQPGPLYSMTARAATARGRGHPCACRARSPSNMAARTRPSGAGALRRPERTGVRPSRRSPYGVRCRRVD